MLNTNIARRNYNLCLLVGFFVRCVYYLHTQKLYISFDSILGNHENIYLNKYILKNICRNLAGLCWFLSLSLFLLFCIISVYAKRQIEAAATPDVSSFTRRSLSTNLLNRMEFQFVLLLRERNEW